MERFGKYYLLDKIATGGMAEVYLSKIIGAEGVNKFIAIKRVLPQFSENDEFNAMFKEEAKIAVNISHSNVVHIYDFGEENDRLYLSMEYVPGKNLRQILNTLKKRQEMVPLPYAISIINEVAKGLDHAHKCFDRTTGRPLNIIHRDISPQNIMMSFEGEVKLLDFGIAKAESKIETTKAGTLKGKFGYMSPEQAEGLELDSRTDIFSLGIVLWEILADERLFMAKNEIQTIRRIRDCVVPSLSKMNPEVSADLEKIVMKALARDRNLRYQSAGEMHKDLNTYLNRHFPDFTLGDLGNFMRRLYNDEIMDLREQMIEYAALGAQESIDPGWMEEGEDRTRILSDAASNFLENSKTYDPLAEIEKQKQENNIQNWQKAQTRTHSISSGLPGGPYARSAGEKSYLFQNLLMVFAVGLVSYYVFTEYSHWFDPIKQWLNPTEQTKTLASTDNSETQEPTEERYRFFIHSTPPGAAIFINGQESGFYTPGRIEVKPQTAFNISLQRQGYFPFTRKLVATEDGQQFRAELVKASFGYISLEVVPSQAVIYINNQKLSERPPLNNFPVYANERIHIRAYSPTTGASAEKYITVKPDTHKRLSLFLKK